MGWNPHSFIVRIPPFARRIVRRPEVPGDESLRNARLGLPDGHPVVAVAMLARAGALSALRRQAEAEALALDAWERNMAHFGASHQRTQECVKLLAGIYARRAAAEPGQGFDAKAAEWKASLQPAGG